MNSARLGEAKRGFQNKLETQFHQADAGRQWPGENTIGYKPKLGAMSGNDTSLPD